MDNTKEEAPIFYPDLGEFATPEPGQAEGLTLKALERPERAPRADRGQDPQ